MSDGEHIEAATTPAQEHIEAPPAPAATESGAETAAPAPEPASEPAHVESDRVGEASEIGSSSAGTPAAEAGEELSKRLFVRPIKFDTSMEDVEKLFTTIGEVKEISLKPGYGFIEYVSVENADEAIAKLNKDASLGYEISIERAMARGTRRERDDTPRTERPPRPTANHRLEITGVDQHFSWQDLKDFARTQGVEAVFTKVSHEGVGLIDVATEADRDLVAKLSGTEWKGSKVDVKEDPRGPPPPPPRREPRFGDRRGGGRGGFGGDRRGRGGFGGDRRGGGRGGFGGDRDRGRFGGDRYGGDRYGGDRFERRDRGRYERERERSRSPRRSEESW